MRRLSMVGARELKTRLGTYLQRVRQGESLVVTERGQPVAELRPVGPGNGDLEARLARMEAAGVLTRPRRRRLPKVRPIRSRGRSGAEAIVEDREERF